MDHESELPRRRRRRARDSSNQRHRHTVFRRQAKPARRGFVFGIDWRLRSVHGSGYRAHAPRPDSAQWNRRLQRISHHARSIHRAGLHQPVVPDGTGRGRRQGHFFSHRHRRRFPRARCDRQHLYGRQRRRDQLPNHTRRLSNDVRARCVLLRLLPVRLSRQPPTRHKGGSDGRQTDLLHRPQ